MKIITKNTKYGNFSYFINDHAFIVELYKGKMFEEDLIEKIKPFIENSKIIIDIGAHAGSHSFMYNKINSNASIYSFEPQKNMYDLLNYNLYQNNSCNNIKTYNLALGHTNMNTHMMDYVIDGPTINAKIEYGSDCLFNLGGLSLGSSGEPVKMMTLDKFVEDEQIAVDFIKIDVEGAESLVAKGALNTIEKFKPIIFFEDGVKTINEEMIGEYGSSIIEFESLPSLLKRNNYNLMNLDSNNIIAVPENFTFKYF